MTTALQKSVQQLGSQRKLAEAIGVSSQTVWAWIDRGTPVPADKCVAIERATAGAVTRKELRPDDWAEIWPELVDAA